MCFFVFPDLLKAALNKRLQEAGARRAGGVNFDQRHANDAFFDVDRIFVVSAPLVGKMRQKWTSANCTQSGCSPCKRQRNNPVIA
jgi:hypothetical protein